jgi:hypothetical protein
MSHCDRLLARLQLGPITPMEAWSELGIYRLGARIFELKRAGHKIIRKTVVVKNRHNEDCRVAQYSLEPSKGAAC